METLTLNRLPVPTWNSLRVNSTETTVGNEFFATAPAVTLPDGVKCEKKDIKTALKELEETVSAIPAEAIVAGKQPIYKAQHFETALGGDFTGFIDGHTENASVFTVAKGSKVTAPVIVKLVLNDGAELAEQNIIYAMEDSSSTFIFIRESEKEAGGELLSETKIVTGKNAYVRVINVNLTGTGFRILEDMGTSLCENAEFELTQLLLGGSKTYTGCKADQNGEGSKFRINTGYLAENGQELDINYHTVQRARNTESGIYVKGSLKNEAKKAFRGTIDFRRGSSGSVGDEQEDVLLFDDNVVNKTIPVILTEVEDVKGRHGGSMGNLAADTLFYMGTRGIDKNTAEMLITKGRLVSIAATIPHEETIGRINGFIREAFSEC